MTSYVSFANNDKEVIRELNDDMREARERIKILMAERKELRNELDIYKNAKIEIDEYGRFWLATEEGECRPAEMGDSKTCMRIKELVNESAKTRETIDKLFEEKEIRALARLKKIVLEKKEAFRRERSVVKILEEMPESEIAKEDYMERRKKREGLEKEIKKGIEAIAEKCWEMYI